MLNGSIVKNNCIKGGIIIIKKVIVTLAVIIGMIILLDLMVRTYFDLQKAKDLLSDKTFRLFTTMSLWAFLFGVLLEWRGLERIFKRNFNFNWILLVPTVLLSVVVFIPNGDWLIWNGTSLNFYPNIFVLPETHIVLSVLAGTMLVRSFTDNK